MSSVLKISHLCKEYPLFQLKDVSFEVEPGNIMGFIGRNGTGTYRCGNSPGTDYNR